MKTTLEILETVKETLNERIESGRYSTKLISICYDIHNWTECKQLASLIKLDKELETDTQLFTNDDERLFWLDNQIDILK
jgi:hypothetical protein